MQRLQGTLQHAIMFASRSLQYLYVAGHSVAIGIEDVREGAGGRVLIALTSWRRADHCVASLFGGEADGYVGMFCGGGLLLLMTKDEQECRSRTLCLVHKYAGKATRLTVGGVKGVLIWRLKPPVCL